MPAKQEPSETSRNERPFECRAVFNQPRTVTAPPALSWASKSLTRSCPAIAPHPSPMGALFSTERREELERLLDHELGLLFRNEVTALRYRAACHVLCHLLPIGHDVAEQ